MKTCETNAISCSGMCAGMTVGAGAVAVAGALVAFYLVPQVQCLKGERSAEALGNGCQHLCDCFTSVCRVPAWSSMSQ